ncbi:hypothetical protein BKA67DRAFT_660565 [Truncatella angustata]|uniref:Uncharacterized protein n=1 Tax=Truncatella angustata TaxID=152316 RepID=A0A9P8UGU8_9PEZI|nr:uncharacterized protein BKA67DRAFT_660565 [Truncatella angustata]KAH6651777.1 hypothetical protein BKA67DRAFT_660565 [Truncatella angustata]
MAIRDCSNYMGTADTRRLLIRRDLGGEADVRCPSEPLKQHHAPGPQRTHVPFTKLGYLPGPSDWGCAPRLAASPAATAGSVTAAAKQKESRVSMEGEEKNKKKKERLVSLQGEEERERNLDLLGNDCASLLDQRAAQVLGGDGVGLDKGGQGHDEGDRGEGRELHCVGDGERLANLFV